MSASRAALLNTLRDQPEPLRLAALVAASSLHENTVREHLDGLRRAGLVRRRRAQPTGRGRPAWLYEATDTDPDVAEYAGLAAALAASIARTSPNPGRTPRPRARSGATSSPAAGAPGRRRRNGRATRSSRCSTTSASTPRSSRTPPPRCD